MKFLQVIHTEKLIIKPTVSFKKFKLVRDQFFWILTENSPINDFEFFAGHWSLVLH